MQNQWEKMCLLQWQINIRRVMDFIRAAIKGLFYKFPIERAVSCLNSVKDDMFLNSLKEVLRWENPQFTTTETGILENVISQTWMKPYMRNTDVSSIPIEGRSLFVLFHFGCEVLDHSSWEKPLLQFDHLLRWRDLAYYMGEDILTLPFLAEQDSMRMYERKAFAWENVIRHNNKALNRVLDRGLSEVHSHLNASTDVFELNWIRLMNEVCHDLTSLKEERKRRLMMKDYRQDFSPSLWDVESGMTLYDWGIVAAAIRVLLYRVVMQGAVIESRDLSRLGIMMNDKVALYEQETEILSSVGSFEENAFRMANEVVFDYAITKSSASNCKTEDLLQPFFIHQGERELLYRFFRMLHENVNRVWQMAPFVYLYLLIKNNYRREFVQTNPLIGFENFQRYQSRKALYLKKQEINRQVNFRYAIQTSLRDIENEKLETRMAPEQVGKQQRSDFLGSIFLDKQFYQHALKDDDLTFVVHFFKRPDKFDVDNRSRHSEFRVYLQNQMDKIIDLCKDPIERSIVKKTKIVGIDAAGAELSCRPEVFAPSFRYAQICGIGNITYHAGEDFYDLVDGLRTIDEVMMFMNYQRGCRIGHALALGIDARSYYGRRHRNVIMPRQVMLDNLVWLFYKARQINVVLSPATLDFIDNTAHNLFQTIGYVNSFDQFIYWQSMLLRGDDPAATFSEGVEVTPHERAARCKHPLCIEARRSEVAKLLCTQYDIDKRTKELGNQPSTFILPASIVDDISALQEGMMDDIERRGIYIECNPSSNLMIGPFEKYEELPIWRFHNVDRPQRHCINISINTDDKGVFATSLYNELSIVSLSMIKRKDRDGNMMWSPKEVLEYVERLVEMGHSERFSPVKVWLAN